MAFTTLLIALACLVASVKGDQYIIAQFASKEICEAKDGIPISASVNDFDTSACTKGTVLGVTVYSKYACTNGAIVRTGYTTDTCTGSSQVFPTSASIYSCSSFSGVYASAFCSTGTFKAPASGVTQTSFSDDKCAVATNTWGKSSSFTWYPVNTCIDAGASNSQKYSCSGGKPTITGYGATKCSGTSQSVPMSTDCTVSTGGGSYKWDTCTSSGAASTSITILSLALLVLATFSSTM